MIICHTLYKGRATHRAQFKLPYSPVLFLMFTNKLYSNVPIHWGVHTRPVTVTLGLRREGEGGLISEHIIFTTTINTVMQSYAYMLEWVLTRPLSTSWVSITITWLFCSHTIRQKSSKVAGKGPWVATYARLIRYPCHERKEVIEINAESSF